MDGADEVRSATAGLYEHEKAVRAPLAASYVYTHTYTHAGGRKRSAPLSQGATAEYSRRRRGFDNNTFRSMAAWRHVWTLSIYCEGSRVVGDFIVFCFLCV